MAGDVVPPPVAGAPIYKKPVALCGDAHRHHGLLAEENYEFARQAIAFPVAVTEFWPAARHYPIVFSPGPQRVPLAVTGIFEGHNLHVNAQGRWRTDHYVPGYLRRYPFVLRQQSGQADDAMLFIDEGCSRFVDARLDPRARRLFNDDGEATEITRRATSFCADCFQEEGKTASFCRLLSDAGLIKDSHVQLRLANGFTQTVQGFGLLDESAYRAIVPERLAQWFKSGILDAITLQLVSQRNWDLLLALHQQEAAAQVSQ